MPAVRIATAVAILLVLPGCGSDVAARVGAREITAVDLEAELSAIRGNTRYVSYIERATEGRVLNGDLFSPAFIAQILTARITAIALEDEVERRSLIATSDDRKASRNEATAAAGDAQIFASFPPSYQQELSDRALDRVLLRRVLTESVTPKSYYADNTDEFVTPCSRHILAASPSEAEAARRRILRGERFAHVARDVSIDEGSAPKGGDIGCNRPDDLLPALDDATFEQPVGRVGPVIKTDEGYNLLLVESRNVRPFGTVRGSVAGAIEQLGRERLETLVEDRLDSLGVEVGTAFGTWNGEEVRIT